MIIKGSTDLFIRMIIFCPKCGTQHIDRPNTIIGWTNPPHKTHECQECLHAWRPFDYPTMGVMHIDDDVEVIQ